MIKFIHLVLFLGFLYAGCGSSATQKETTSKNKMEPSTLSTLATFTANDKWLYYYNNQSDSLNLLYDSSSIKITPDGNIIKGNQQIVNHILSNSSTIVATKSDTIIIANSKRKIEYEINENTYANDEQYKTLIIWQTNHQERKRVFEFTIKVETVDHITEEIDKRRDLWMNLCNQHNTKQLIQTLYSKNTLYFNHKPIVKGREALLEEYQYMNKETYQLALHPSIVDRISEDFIFEIGQCEGSYNGKYILIWQKDTDGKWRIFIDSNI